MAGRCKSLAVKLGDRINQGDLIASVETAAACTGGGTAGPAAAGRCRRCLLLPRPRRRGRAGEKEPLRRPVMARPSDAPRGKAHASPGVRRFARELGVDLYYVPGSGPKGRVTKEDVQAFVKRALAEGRSAAMPGYGRRLRTAGHAGDRFLEFGEIEEQELGRIKKLSGAHLHRAWLNVPHVTQFDEADITELEAFRKAQKDEAAKAEVKLTFMPFLMKAVVQGAGRSTRSSTVRCRPTVRS